MLKKVLIVLVALILVVVAAVMMMPSKKAAPPPPPKKKQAPAKPWNGALATSPDVQETFVRGAQEMTFDSINYSGLDGASATAVVTLSATKPSNNKPPRWMTTPGVITARSVVGVSYRPTTQINDLGSSYQETATFHNLPVSQLVQSQIGLIIRSQAGAFSVGLTPPPPPAGHNYGENIAKEKAQLPARPAVAYSTKRLARHRLLVRVFARSSAGLSRLVVNVDGRRIVKRGHATHLSASLRLRRGHHRLLAVARDAQGQSSRTLRVTVRVR